MWRHLLVYSLWTSSFLCCLFPLLTAVMSVSAFNAANDLRKWLEDRFVPVVQCTALCPFRPCNVEPISVPALRNPQRGTHINQPKTTKVWFKTCNVVFQNELLQPTLMYLPELLSKTWRATKRYGFLQLTKENSWDTKHTHTLSWQQFNKKKKKKRSLEEFDETSTPKLF